MGETTLARFLRQLPRPRSSNEKIRIFQESDIFALPTWYPLEGQPVAIIEAMAAGLPVLTTRHATITDILARMVRYTSVSRIRLT